MKIIIALLVPILLGIVVGSNLSPTIAVVILNQPTISLPIGVWLLVAIGLGLLSSLLIQLLVFLDRRLLKRQIRQLQSRLQQQDEDIFTYTSSAPKADSSATEKSVGATAPQQNPPPTATSRFKSYRSNLTDRFTRKPVDLPIVVDEDRDDWAAEPVSNRQLDWEDSRSSRQQNLQSRTDRIYPDRNPQKIQTPAQQTSREVYDADFRLIQPPYKEPLETEFEDDRDLEDFEYAQTDEAEDFDPPASATKPTSPNRATASDGLDDEDWGFDFDDRDTPVRAK